MAVAIGNPLGELGGTVTAGIISALDRELSIDGKTMTLLQTDSSINPGNSGGGLFNGDGQLIGIVVAKSSGSDVEGLGFAIPINKAADVAQQLMDNGYVKGQPYTGMSYTEGSQQSDFDSFFSNGSSSSSKNVYIASVDSSKAKRAGFQAGDMVFAVDGKQITSFRGSVVDNHLPQGRRQGDLHHSPQRQDSGHQADSAGEESVRQLILSGSRSAAYTVCTGDMRKSPASLKIRITYTFDISKSIEETAVADCRFTLSSCSRWRDAVLSDQ